MRPTELLPEHTERLLENRLGNGHVELAVEPHLEELHRLANEVEGRDAVWSADFVFDRTAEGRVLKCPTVIDDATTEAVAVVPARALGGGPVTRVLEALALTRGLPQVLRTDNGPEFCGRTMLTLEFPGFRGQ